MPIPYQLGRFRLLQPLADDGRTAVGLYADPYGQPVTIRTLSDAVVADPAAQQWFRQGAYASGPVLEVGDAPDGRPYIVAPAPSAPGFPGYYGPPKRRVWPIVTAICAVLVLGAGAVTAIVLTRGNGSASHQADSSTLLPSPASASASTSPEPSPTPALGTPQVGECRDLPFAAGAALSDATPTVDCQQTHTALTYYVGTYQDNREDNGYAGSTCETKLPGALGASAKAAKLSAYTVAFFEPTKEQWSAGARWFRCDLVLSAAKSFIPLPAAVAPLPAPLPDSLAACRVGQTTTPCNQQHTMRAVATVTYSSTGPNLPAAQALVNQATRKCPQGTSYYTWPATAEWKYGARLGLCWKQTSD